ncbi:MAG: radical SAM protein, partial [Candidatus Binatia bacterium]
MASAPHAFSVYVHVPYCRAICPYCDFNVHRASPLPEERYVDALASELRAFAATPPFAGRPVATIYFGGGTPSVFRAAAIGRVIDEVAAAFGVEASAEITLEANPEDLAVRALQDLRGRGVNRLSIGIQSFEPRHLRRLGRGGCGRFV